MLLRMSQALGRIVLAGREMTRLAGGVKICNTEQLRESFFFFFKMLSLMIVTS